MSLPSDNASSSDWRDASVGDALPAAVREPFDDRLPTGSRSSADVRSGSCVVDAAGPADPFDDVESERPHDASPVESDDAGDAAPDRDPKTSAAERHTPVSGKNPEIQQVGAPQRLAAERAVAATLAESERAAIERDIEIRLAQKIKRDLLPRSVPRLPGFKIGNVFRPAQQPGGDYLDFVPLPDRSWVVAIGDASGHGIEAALLMAQTRAYLRALALGHTDVGKMLTLMNRRLVEDTLEEHYVTLFLARVLPESRSLVYSNAGHLPGFLLDAEGRLKKVLPCTGIPLGLDSNILYSKEAGIALQNGDRLLLFTDGVSEARDSDQSLFGVERAVKAVRSRLADEPDVVLQALLDEVQAFTGGRQADDQTAMLMQVERPA